jgi:hypothetical protein
MTAESHRGRTHPASGTEAPSGSAIPLGTAAEPDTSARRDATPSLPLPLPLPGLPFSVDPKRLLWYGGLAALATVGVLEWPVAAVVGVGSFVSERLAREDALRAARQRS